jgi:phosphate transport system permease protein
MRRLKTLPRFRNYLKERGKAGLLSCSLVFVAGLIIAFFGASQLPEAINTWLSSDVLIGEPFNIMFAKTITSILTILLSLPVFIISYLLIESHSLGIKLSLGVAAIFFALAFLGSFNFTLAIIMGALCMAAAIIKTIEKRGERKQETDSPIITENVVKFGLRLSGFVSIIILFGMFIYIAARGIGYVNWEFLTGKWNWVSARKAVSTGVGSIGGISDFIIGSVLIVSLCEAIAIPLGLGAAIFLSEYAKDNKITDTIRFFVETLAGAPSVVLGIFAYYLFGQLLGWNYSLLGGALALAFMILPWNIRVAEEAMRAVPQSYREGAYAIGATKSQTIRSMVLYAGSPGIITGIILGLGAAIGETAVLMFTVSAEGVEAIHSLSLTQAQVPSLAVWIYNAFTTLQSQGAIPEGRGIIASWEQQNVCLAGALVLVVMFLAICLVALVARNYMSKKIAGR